MIANPAARLILFGLAAFAVSVGFLFWRADRPSAAMSAAPPAEESTRLSADVNTASRSSLAAAVPLDESAQRPATTQPELSPASAAPSASESVLTSGEIQDLAGPARTRARGARTR